MRKIFYTVFSISQICFLLLYPQEALAASKEGMQLWLNVLLPVLLPFLILRGILIHTNMAGKLLQPVEVIWNKVLGVSAAGAYAVIVGALCGYPVGAKITSDLYENHQISAVDMHAEDLESNKLICYPVIQGERINYQNK